MRIATLVSWSMTASLGAFMLTRWLVGGGWRRRGGLPPQVILSHMGLGLTGLALWASFAATGTRPLSWLAVMVITVGIALGICAVTLWTPYPLRDPPRQTVPARPPAGGFSVTDEMIERFLADPFPESRRRAAHGNVAALVPLVHGIGAITTFVLAVMTTATA